MSDMAHAHPYEILWRLPLPCLSRFGIVSVMAKLKDLQHLLERIAQVDAARARTLVMKARAAGHFTTGGRGVNAPNMTPRDATNTLLLALQMDAPTEAGEAVTALRDLPISVMLYNPGDHEFRAIEAKHISLVGDEFLERLPPDFEGRLPATLGEALDLLFGREDSFANRFDRIVHYRSSRFAVELEIADRDHRVSGIEEGPKAWVLDFARTERLHDDPLGASATRSVYCEALRALRDLIHDPTPEEADEVLADG